ncbi:phosphatidylinositol transfer protein 1-like [Ipomoea triloba]|uniref:phosphatidylinositol transfer protein 1-like n=1 Tax=Ipomoea triloba TaxID=35885 RepID=UPI00125D6CDF|nr:phosphatidylinositol transfer protein 1-like [Ipomoea triloba]
MVLIKEFRIVLPLSLEEYERAQMYIVMKMLQQNTTGNEGVEILENKSFDDDEYGQGQYTSKIYRFHSKVPSWLTAFAPANALATQEEAWNAYPMCKTVMKCPFFSKLSLTIETIHKADNGHSENVHGLSKEQLAAREVETIDIASAASDYWSFIVGRCNVDFSKFRSARTGRGPLLEGWKDNCSPVMTAYKLVTVNVPYWGFGRKLEKTLMAAERALFLESHRNCFAWIDEWIGLTLEVMQELEQQSDCSLNKKLGTHCSVDNNRTAGQEESPDGERALA